MLADVKTILWLQWKLTLSMFRARRLALLARLGRLVLMLFLFVTTLPFFVGMGIFLGIVVANLSAEAAFELILIVNTAMLFFWLLMPASYSAQFMERFEMSRLFPHPVRLKSLVVGSTLVSLLTMAGLWSLPMLAGEVGGLVWQRPLLLPIIFLGAVPTFAILVLSGRLMEDLLDLVAGDRRLRGLLIFLLSLPFFLLLFGNYYIQFLTAEPGRFEATLRAFATDLPPLAGLGFEESANLILTHLRLSRFLLWLPPGWATAGMALSVAGRWVEAIAFLALSYAAVAAMAWVHATVIRRMMQGTALRIGAERVRARRRDWHRPGPAAFWALFDKDWAYLRRNPVTLRALVATPIVIVAFGVGLWQMSNLAAPDSRIHDLMPFLIAGLVVIAANAGTSNLTADYFGAVDREGLATLMVSPVDHRYVFLSANVVTLLFALAQTLVVLAIVALLMGTWLIVPWGLLFAFCLHYASAPFYNLASILTPYRASAQLTGSNQGNLGSMIAWIVSLPIPAGLFMLPIVFSPAAQIVTLPLALFFALGLYLLTLNPTVRLLDRRTHQVLESVLEES
ncbi:MAG TPA: hypothetical protein VLC95_13990 [Anaerolineae bacterium]|nr:hypothetical protein [Anaerolineae bacterium]